MSTRFEFTYGTQTRTQAFGRESQVPLRIGVLADFSGRSNRGEAAAGLSDARLWRIDLDNAQSVLAGLAPALELPLDGQGESRLAVDFQTLEDFHPDALFSRLAAFQAMAGVRERLGSPDTFAAAAGELGFLTGAPPAESAAADVPQADRPPAESNTDLVERLLGKPASRSRPAAGPAARAVGALLRDLVAPYVVPDPDPRQEDCVRQLDAAIGGRMRALLHHPDFQALEAAWRSVQFLVSRVELGEEVQLYLIDVSKDELAADLGAAAGLEASAVGGLLTERSSRMAGEAPWGLLVGAYTFGADPADVVLLRRIGQLAAGVGAPFVAAAAADLVGCVGGRLSADVSTWTALPSALGDAWKELRSMPEAALLALSLPGFLLRLPYGAGSDPIESFDFEELSAPDARGEYLWGSGAFLCALLLAEAYGEEAWGFSASGFGEVGGLPMHAATRDGETLIMPCGELWLTDTAVDRILDRGLMPVQSIRGRDAVRMCMRSLSSSRPALAGRWSG